MRAKIIVPKDTKVVVFGDIHEHDEQFDLLLKQFSPSDKLFLVSVGDLYDKGFGKDRAEYMIDKLKPFVKKQQAFIIQGNHELSNIKYTKPPTSHLKWFSHQPLSLSFEFSDRMLVTVVHGGVRRAHTWDDLSDNTEICYVRKVDRKGKMVKLLKREVDGKRVMEFASPGKIWHTLYDGRFGYIVSGHDSQKDGIPKFYNYSCNIDTSVYNTGKLTAQVFYRGKKEDTVIIEGKAAWPDIEAMQRLMAQGRI